MHKVIAHVCCKRFWDLHVAPELIHDFELSGVACQFTPRLNKVEGGNETHIWVSSDEGSTALHLAGQQLTDYVVYDDEGELTHQQVEYLKSRVRYVPDYRD